MGEERKYAWVNALTDRERSEIEFARIYAEHFAHGTDGHSRLVLIDKLVKILNQFEGALDALEDKNERT